MPYENCMLIFTSLLPGPTLLLLGAINYHKRGEISYNMGVCKKGKL